GVRRRYQRLYRRGRSLRGTDQPRAAHRHRAARAGGVGAHHPRQARGARARPLAGDRMSVATAAKLIQPHGGRLVDHTGERRALEKLETLTLTGREVSDLDMRACEALSPVDGFMNPRDYDGGIDDLPLANGLPA